MHSSRMRTARLLTVSQHALRRGCLPGGGCLPRGCVCPGGVYLEGCLPREVSVRGMADTPHPVNGMTDRQVYKYYLAANSLRVVIILKSYMNRKHVLIFWSSLVCRRRVKDGMIEKHISDKFS